MQAERIVDMVRDVFPSLRKTPDPTITAGADYAKDQKREIARRLGIEKEIVITQSSKPRIGTTRTI